MYCLSTLKVYHLNKHLTTILFSDASEYYQPQICGDVCELVYPTKHIVCLKVLCFVLLDLKV